ncbi:uncharacterized protein isoform X2 [Rhodnius prolixus]|uniref:uncharacterized protein isoform X2 n=1 Tax=Rhodnius prolixus TaxID=13249 RepID=UPI003D18CA18
MDSTVSRQRKESTLQLDQPSLPTTEMKFLTDHAYPFAKVLRLRVLQIVCGIACLVLGSVAFIEEGGQLNLGLGIPAGLFTVLAAGVSVHTSRGFSGYRDPNCASGLRFLGPRPSIALPLTLLWAAACILLTALIVLSSGELVLGAGGRQLSVLAGLLLALAAAILAAVLTLLRIDCRYDPD